MRVIHLLAVAAVLGGTYHFWRSNDSVATEAVESANGFVPVVMPDGAKPNTVLILAPVNCPSDAAKRADMLARELTRLGIPNARGSSFSVDITNPTPEQRNGVERATSVFNTDIPSVFINGMAKPNPTASEAAAEYQRTRSGS